MRRHYKSGGQVERKRDYKTEYDSYHAQPEQKKRRAQRNAARRKLEASGAVQKGDGKDVDHKNRQTADNSRSNLRVTSQQANRGWRKGKS
jgi:hypothetical protein